MSRHLSSKSTDLNQKLSRQMTSKKRKSSPAFRRDSDDGFSERKTFKVKEKYNNWKYQSDDDFEGQIDEPELS